MRKTRWKVYLSIVILIVLLNIAAWNSRAFCDWYISHLFPVWVNTYGRIMGLFPFSVGEVMIVLGLTLVAAAVLLGVALLIAKAVRGIRTTGKRRKAGRKCPGSMNMLTLSLAKQEKGQQGMVWQRFCRFCTWYYQAFAWILLGVSVIMTLNCFILYHGSTFSEKYFGMDEKEYSLEELTRLRNFVVEQCNKLSAQMTRDEDGSVIYTGDMATTAKEAMSHLGETYGNLDGFYPTPKPLKSSDFMSQQYMAGYYFPFSMEANYNDVMYVLNKPATFCHELAHLKGYIYEDEANFIGYLACIQSEDLFFQYSGYLSVLYYVDNDFYDAVGHDKEKYLSQPRILQQVHEDNVFLTQEEWDRIEEKAVLDTEVVDAVSDSLTDASLKLNGVSDGMISYSRVVKLLLQYYNIYGYGD